MAKKVKKMKDNKSPGVDSIPPKLLKEIVEQISTSLAKVFNLSLQKGYFLQNGKKQTLGRYLRRDRVKSKTITGQ